jgi:4-oxalmesaconate hydratase
MVGAVRGIDPRTGHHVDDTRRYVEAVGPAPGDREKVFQRNARRVYPRLDAALAARGR